MDYFEYRGQDLHAEDVRLDWVFAQEVGTPCYVYSKRTAIEHYRKLADAFKDVAAEVHYSVKACSNLNLLKIFAAEGAGFDVVSAGELFRVLEAGVPGSRVVFAGVGKTDDEIRYALKSGIAQFNAESGPEIERLNEVALEMHRQAPVCLRVNPDVDPKTHTYITTGKKENKFGVDFEQARRVLRDLSHYPGIKLLGLHTHIGSQITDVSPYVRAVDRILDFIDLVKKDGVSVSVLNLGGGFGIYYKDRSAPPAIDFGRAICPLLKGRPLKVQIEPGRFIVGNAGILLTRVIYVKRSGAKRFVIVDAAMNDLIRPALYGSYHQVWPAKAAVARGKEEGLEPADVVGPVCESGDFFAQDRPFPEVKRGDLVAVFSAGAYGMAMASNYNTRPRPAEVLVDGASWKVIRRRETFEDLVAQERV